MDILFGVMNETNFTKIKVTIMKAKISILFYGKKAKITTEGLLPIYLRVTIEGKRIELTTKRYVEVSKWSSESGRVKGSTEEARTINKYFDQLKQEVYNYENDLKSENKDTNYDNLKNKILGTEIKARMLVPIFQKHNDEVKAQLGDEFASGTLERYKTSLKHTVDFMKWKFSITDIDIKSINHEFITDYEFYLRTVRKCNNNSAVKYIKNFGKIIRICLANGWLDKNPFANYKAKIKEVERQFLNEEEIQRISDKKFHSDRLNQVRDIFLFSCYTGLAYADVKKLDESQIVIGIDGEKWIYTNRQKTDTQSNIPLLPFAQSILDKYKNHPQCKNQNRLLPVLSNQKMNSYLKEIADFSGITKDLTFHIARHTFATTITLSNGVPIESVSKMLGHKDLKITQHYAKIVDRKVGNDMMLLRAKLSPQLIILSETKIGSN